MILIIRKHIIVNALARGEKIILARAILFYFGNINYPKLFGKLGIILIIDARCSSLYSNNLYANSCDTNIQILRASFPLFIFSKY